MHIPDKVISKNFPVLLLVYAIFCYSLAAAPAFHSVAHTITTDTVRPDGNTRLLHLGSNDTLPNKKRSDTTRLPDSSKIVVTDTFNIKFSNDSLEAPIVYKAEDSMVYDVPAKTITLYGKEAKTNYKDNELTAPLIVLEQESGNINAIIKRDSAGKVISMPTFKQGGDFTSTSDTIRFNLKTGKGLTKSTYTQQGEMYVYGEVIKKVSPEVFYVKRGRFTTCNLDTPHFAFISNRVKFINKKVAISGPVHPEFEGVPVPIYLPFGIFPLNSSRHSGFLPPTFSANEQLGLGLEGIGYYKIIGNYWDVVTRANLYSYGGWTLSINPRYSKKYRYSGTIGLDIQNFKYNFKGDPDFRRNRSYNVRWSHAQDSKARPGVSFSANVNAGSSSFNSYVPNNPYQNFSNQLTSSIVYSKTWKDKPFNLTVSANHNQNNIQKLINVNLPDVAFNVNTLYPFRRKEAAGNPAWYENLGIGYQGNAKSLFAFYDTTSNIMKHIIDTLQWGAHHSIPISLSLPQIGFLQVSPSISYDATTYQHKIVRRWDDVNKKVDTTTYKGVYSAQQVSFGLGLATRIFGMFAPKKKDSRLIAIRHEIRPSLSFNYKPDLNKRNYNYIQVDTTGRKLQLPMYEGNIFGPYAPGKFGGISFGVDNNLTMKVRNKKDTSAGATKKITLLDGLSINGSYNLMADSFRLSNLDLSARSTLFDKVSLTAGATFDPY
jgi:LPS-assembly protein